MVALLLIVSYYCCAAAHGELLWYCIVSLPLNHNPFCTRPHDLCFHIRFHTLCYRYAIGIGCNDEKFIYSLNPQFQMFPTFPVSLFFKGDSDDAHEMRKNAVVLSADNPFPGKAYGVRTGLDGERYIECVNPLPLEGGEFVWKTEFTGIFRKGNGGVLSEYVTTMEDQSGKVYYKFWSGQFSMGKIAEFDDAGESQSVSVAIPDRAPDAIEAFSTSPLQSYMYSLTGDFNSVHVDAALGERLGYGGVILQGLAFCGISSRAVLRHFGGNEGSAFRAVRVRFSKPVLPGQTLETRMWVDVDGSAAFPSAPIAAGHKRVLFNTICKDTGDTVISNAYMDLKEAEVPPTKARL